jgi:hypothetical protein
MCTGLAQAAPDILCFLPCACAQLVYVAFDILFDEHESLIALPLRQRQQRLAQAVKCLPADPESGLLLGPEGGVIRGRIVTLLPDVSLPLPVAGQLISPLKV